MNVSHRDDGRGHHCPGRHRGEKRHSAGRIHRYSALSQGMPLREAIVTGRPHPPQPGDPDGHGRYRWASSRWPSA
ncbi:MAG: hypothetical protein WKG07_14710 [Hymenobacter sp.]